MTWRLTMMVVGVALGVAAAALGDQAALRISPAVSAAHDAAAPPESTLEKPPVATPPASTAPTLLTPASRPVKTLPLAPSSSPARVQKAAPTKSLDWSMLANTGASLGIVLAVLVAVVWLLKRTAPKSAAPLPKEAFEVLGRAPLASRQQAHLVRCGRKLLLVAMTPGGAETLTEITDPAEVDHLAGLCQSSRDGSSSGVFHSVLEQFAKDRTPATNLGLDDERAVERFDRRRHGGHSTEVRRG